MFPPPLAIPPQLSHRLQTARNLLSRHAGLLLCALFALTALATAGNYGIGSDEPNQRQLAQGNLDYILGRADRIATLLDVDRYYGASFELPLLLAEQALGLEDYYYIHQFRAIITHLFFILGGYFCYRLAYRLFNNRAIALFALLFYLLHPRLYGHSFVNSKDLPFLALLMIALYLLERAFRRNTPAAFILLGIAVGLLVNLRIMGLMLFPAVIAMRGLDLLYAAGSAERKQILLTAALFLLTAALTLYAATPYAWPDPWEYLTASLHLTVNHPAVAYQLFQGQWHFSNEFPPHYAAAWFGITTPPLILLLGGLGAAALAAAGLRRPQALFRNTRQRFLLLALACFLLPPLAAALLGSNLWDNWRHFYFLYAPFAILAAAGLAWLTAALFRRQPWRFGLYSLAALGLTLLLLQITQLHPLQPLYFNFLVDRTTPEYLRTHYHLDPWHLAPRAALEQLLSAHPEKTFVVRGPRFQLDALPPALRPRLLPAGAGRSADYELVYKGEPGRPDQAFNYRYSRLYNNTLIGLRPLKAALMTPAAAAAYQEIYRQALAGQPLIHADYTVYRNGNRLTFVKENCPPASPDAAFSASLFPPNQEVPPPDLAEVRWYSTAGVSNHSVRLDNACLAVLQLPAYFRGDLAISQSNLGRHRPAAPVWQDLYSLNPPGLRERIAQRRQGQPPPPPHAFALFLDQAAAGRPRLLYAKKDCAQEEYETRIFLHLTPRNRAALPFYQWQSGVDNRDFSLSRYGLRPGGECIAVYPLPDYPIAALLTGQAGIWETGLYPPPDPEQLRAAAAALAGRQPNARAPFNLYLQDNQLTYWRETCNAADTAANFFLHLTPQDPANLPADRQAAGFANQDFPFARHGGPFNGQCLAAVPLPPYPLAAIRTGQYVAGQGELWAIELNLEQ